MKKNLLVLICFFFALQLGASHMTSGEIWYKYVGNQTGIANQYQIGVTLYAPMTGISFPDSLELSLCSSCFSTSTIWLPFDSLVSPLPDNNLCVGMSAVINFSAYHFSGKKVLPGICGDFVFNFSTGTRLGGIDNLVNSSNLFFQLRAELNNLQGYNSSPTYMSYPRMNLCAGIPAIWKNPIIESDGDSIAFLLTSALGGSTCQPIALPYASGYSATSPVTTLNAIPPQFSGNNGTLGFTPISAEIVTIKVQIEEFRPDTIYGTWLKVGSIMRDIIVAIVPNCTLATSGLYYDYSAMPVYVHATNGLPTLDKLCVDSLLTIKLNKPTECSSIAPDGSDFRLTAPNGQPIPIKRAIGQCNSLLETQEVQLSLYGSYNLNGNHILYSKTGSDGNTLVSSCGIHLFEYDTLQINVTGCSGIGISEQEMAPAPIIPTALRLGNPFSITFPETLVGDYQLSFYNLQGALLFTEAFHGSGNWGVQNAGAISKPGMYVCRLQSATEPDRQWQQKVMVLP